MILSDLVSQAYLHYRGKLSNVPASGDEKYTRILTLANVYQRQWANDSNVDWPSRYEVRNVGSVALGVQEYDLDDDILNLSDYVELLDTLGNKKYIQVLKPETLSQYINGAYVSGSNPKQLTFLTPIDAALAGMTINLPIFTMPSDLVNPNDTVAVDNPNWLAYVVASELARNDYAKEEQYPNLIGIANDLYTNMVNDAQSNSFLQPNGVVNNMPQAPSLGGTYYGTWGINS